MASAWLAQTVMLIHLGYVAFVVLGQLAIVIGLARGWEWVRGSTFRVLHLTAMAIVAFETAAGLPCPLTELEYHFRAKAGQTPPDIPFIERMVVHNLVFFEGVPRWVYRACCLGFGLVVASTFLLAPPRWRTEEVAPCEQPSMS